MARLDALASAGRGFELDFFAFRIKYLRDTGMLEAGQIQTLTWTGHNGHFVQVEITTLDQKLILRYEHRSVGSATRCTRWEIELTRSRCRYGGTRTWFVCPKSGCRKRATVLYCGREIGCRTCQRISYQTQRIQRLDRAMARAQQIRVKLGGTVDLSQPFPGKPKGMHEFTYIRLALKSWRQEGQSNRDISRWVDSVLSKMKGRKA